ncbi:MAG: NYN domain-containing protein [Lachnospiraceae bacterium]|nr:NYN domain-containing protein [Lachnospiraceae bacterium]
MGTDREQQHAHSPGAAGKGSHKNRTCCTGLLAHVDAGKTTLAEAILYLTGRIRALGRVDHQDAYFDHFALERARGITIFSKQAQIVLDGRTANAENGPVAEAGNGRLADAGSQEESVSVTLLDTPGHVDFSAEMERTLQVLDYAILVISAPDGVQSHVDTLWRLLARYEIPVFLFINKMDLPGADREELMAHLAAKLDERCVDFSGRDAVNLCAGGSMDAVSGKHRLQRDGRHEQERSERDGVHRKDQTGQGGCRGENWPEQSIQTQETQAQEARRQREEKFQEEMAMCDDRLLEIYASGETIGTDEIRRAIAARHVFPCFFGSALKLEGVEELLDGIYSYSLEKEYPDTFGARVYKISRDAQGNRLTHMKITGGMLRVKDLLAGEKVNQIRIPSGGSFETAQEAAAGTICAVTGPEHTRVGEGLGAEPEAEMPILEPVLSYRIELVETPPRCASADIPPEGRGCHPARAERTRINRNAAHLAGAPEGTDVQRAFRQMKQLEEEEPQLHISWVPAVDKSAQGADCAGEIHAQLMGEVQTEILQDLIRERFGLAVKFGEGSIVYRETIAEPVVGMGHFEPLRHYAEVHLLMEPGERGSGLQFESACGTDELDLNWQRLVLTHLEEKQYPGVLTGSAITDMKITLVAGRAHQKHTEGGDFRQATCRAVRQGLCRAKSILLEPVYRFRMEVPMESVGRALSDIQSMYGTAGTPVLLDDQGQTGMMEITGTAPVVTMRSYQRELLSYTRGRGRLFCTLKGYEECHNAEEVIEARAYDPLLDPDNPCGSVFCAHGAGFVVSWEDVPDYVHIADTDRYADGRLHDGSPAGSSTPGARDGDSAGNSIPGAQDGGSAGNRGSGAQDGGSAGNSGPGVRDGISAQNERQLMRSEASAGNGTGGPRRGVPVPSAKNAGPAAPAADDELRAIFERTYGAAKWEGRRPADGRHAGAELGSRWAGYEAPQPVRASSEQPSADAGATGDGYTAKRKGKNAEPLEECLLVDGYNIIFAWEELKELAKISLESARTRLLDLMCNYQGYKNNDLIVVFDAYRVAGHTTEVLRYHNIHVVYTKEAETADQYIEKTARQIRRRYHVTVATSDALEQIIIFGAGAARLSARGLHDELEQMQKDLRENYLGTSPKGAGTGLLEGWHPAD